MSIFKWGSFWINKIIYDADHQLCLRTHSQFIINHYVRKDCIRFIDYIWSQYRVRHSWKAYKDTKIQNVTHVVCINYRQIAQNILAKIKCCLSISIDTASLVACMNFSVLIRRILQIHTWKPNRIVSRWIGLKRVNEFIQHSHDNWWQARLYVDSILENRSIKKKSPFTGLRWLLTKPYDMWRCDALWRRWRVS